MPDFGSVGFASCCKQSASVLPTSVSACPREFIETCGCHSVTQRRLCDKTTSRIYNEEAQRGKPGKTSQR